MKNLKFVMLLAVMLTLSFNLKADNELLINFQQQPRDYSSSTLPTKCL